jgi:hypothetical protein
MLRFLAIFLLVYFSIKIVRRLLFGPRPKRHVYMQWGKGGWNPQAGADPFNRTGPMADTDNNEPQVGGVNPTQRKMPQNKRLQDIQDAEFEEIKD